MVETLSFVCKILCGVFLVGGAANFGRVYLIQVSGKKQTLLLPSLFEICFAGCTYLPLQQRICWCTDLTVQLYNVILS